jgi:hypothetical protein
MNSAKLQKFQPIVSGEKKLSLSVEGDSVTLSLDTWEEGLGWCTQKTLNFDSDVLEELHGLISAARIRAARNRSEDSGDILGKLISFPS